MKNKKVVLVTIVILLIIFTPLTVLGSFFRKERNILEENPDHLPYYEGKLWFYDDSETLLSSYECQTELCGFATSSIDDDNYGINYYHEGTMEAVFPINDRYAFIKDGALLYLYNIESGSALITYQKLKNYQTNLDNELYILQDTNNLWGALKVGTSLKVVISFSYDFIGLASKTKDENIVLTDKLIVLKDSKWYLIDSEEQELTSKLTTPIIDYNNQYLVSRINDYYHLYDYEGKEYLSTYHIKRYAVTDDYVLVLHDDELKLFKDINDKAIKENKLTNINDEISLEELDGKLNVYVGHNILYTLDV